MRVFLNAILDFIGTASLSDIEFEALTIEAYGYDQDTYEALAEVLVARAAASSFKDRLTYFFKSKGVVIADTVSSANSNIFIGDVLE